MGCYSTFKNSILIKALEEQMGFNKRYLPEISEFKKKFENDGLEKFVNDYRKVDAIIGSEESITFLEEKQKQWKQYQLSLSQEKNKRN